MEEDELPSESLKLLREAFASGLINLVELETIDDFKQVFQKWNVEEFPAFLTLSQIGAAVYSTNQPFHNFFNHQMRETPMEPTGTPLIISS